VDSAVVSFKTQAWTSAAAVSTYAATMHRTSRANTVKNRIEIELIRRGITGNTILDVGVGTGRAAIPLARAGYSVTGMDVSLAMLEQARREAGDLELSLVAGDVAALPFGDASFDSIVSLNCITHFPHWKAILAEWARAVRDGGRLVFDLFSLDYFQAISKAYGLTVEQLRGKEITDPSHYLTRITSDELVAYAATLGLSVESATPYAAVLGGGNTAFWFSKAAGPGPYFERLLSWIGTDDDLAELAYCIEEMAGKLDTRATGSFMVVLVKDNDRSRTDRYIARSRELKAALESGNLDELAHASGFNVATIREKLAAHLVKPKARTMFSMLASAFPEYFWHSFLAKLLPPDVAQQCNDVRGGYRFDRLATAFLHHVNAEAVAPTAARFRGVDLASVRRYDIGHRLVAALLDHDSP
jgi:ubiquinone/menaquinone biosynthesis C-methylase UbiE